jgi:hypothetical protein
MADPNERQLLAYALSLLVSDYNASADAVSRKGCATSRQASPEIPRFGAGQIVTPIHRGEV